MHVLSHYIGSGLGAYYLLKSKALCIKKEVFDCRCLPVVTTSIWRAVYSLGTFRRAREPEPVPKPRKKKRRNLTVRIEQSLHSHGEATGL